MINVKKETVQNRVVIKLPTTNSKDMCSYILIRDISLKCQRCIVEFIISYQLYQFIVQITPNHTISISIIKLFLLQVYRMTDWRLNIHNGKQKADIEAQI